jgi:uncharacterized membrane protein YkvA (DUF1232 family)
MAWNDKLISASVGKLTRPASKLLGNKAGLQRLLGRAVRLAPKLPRLASEELQALLRMIKAHVSRRYTNAPVGTVLKAIAAVIYFVDPLDIMPDPVYIDDAAVITWVLNSMRMDLIRFRAWENSVQEQELLVETSLEQEPPLVV